jgi:hypothetical protein
MEVDSTEVPESESCLNGICVFVSEEGKEYNIE